MTKEEAVKVKDGDKICLNGKTAKVIRADWENSFMMTGGKWERRWDIEDADGKKDILIGDDILDWERLKNG